MMGVAMEDYLLLVGGGGGGGRGYDTIPHPPPNNRQASVPTSVTNDWDRLFKNKIML